MFLEKLNLKQFRNYSEAELSFSSPLTFFVGQNGSGKTSLLEAIYCALRGQSFHSFVQTQFIKKGEKSARIELFLKEKEGNSQIQSSFFLNDFSLRKELLYCGKKVRSSLFSKKFPCFIFTEASLKCLRQGSHERRDFIESLFYTEEQLRAKKEFYQVLKQKKQLLKNYKKELIKEKDFLALFSVMNKTFLEKSKKIVQARLEILNQIFKFLPEVSHDFLNSKTKLGFSYKIRESSLKDSFRYQEVPFGGRSKPEQKIKEIVETIKNPKREMIEQENEKPIKISQKEFRTLNKISKEQILLEQNHIKDEFREQESARQSLFKSIELDLEEKRQIEIQSGMTLSGPQTHEILFLFQGEDSRFFCSKGQQRAYILSLLLSHLKSIPQAFLFLDDVLLELDESVQKRFLQLLEKNHCQIFLTTCNIIPFEVKKSDSFYIEKGQIRKLKNEELKKT